MADVTFAIPGDLEAPTDGYAYDRRVLSLLPSYGITVSLLTLPGAFPRPSAGDLQAARAALAAVPPGTTLLIDGQAYGTLPAALIRGLGRRVLALVHHPLSLDGTHDGAAGEAAETRERDALALAHHVIVTSQATAELIATRFKVEAPRITIAKPGTEPAHRATGTGTPLQILAVGPVTRRRGYEALVAGLLPLVDLDWRLMIAGALDREPTAVASLKDAIEAARMTERILLSGQVVPGTLERYFDAADLFVSAAPFEGYAMALAEAMARGLPIVCVGGGATDETVPEGAALKIPAGDVAALTGALSRTLSDRKLRRRLADSAWEAGRALPTWNETARRIAAALLDLHA